MRLTAANGDVVLAEYSGYFTPVTAGVYSFEGKYFVKDGTGRFQNASGAGVLYGTLQGDFSTFTQTASMTAEGKISY